MGQKQKTVELLLTLVRRDLTVRYQSSVLGFFWSFAKPLALVAIFHIAFNIILRIPAGAPDVSLSYHMLVGVLVWSFFARAVMESHNAVLGHANLIKKIRLPVYVFPATTVVGNLVNFLLGMVVVIPAIVLLLRDVHPPMPLSLLAQIVLFLLATGLVCLFALALSLIVSAANVFYRDVENISEVLFQAWFYATPIVYPVTLLYSGEGFASGRLPQWLEPLYWLNPMTPLCVLFRRILLYRAPNLEVADSVLLTWLGVDVVVIGVVLVLAFWVFKKCSRRFADEV